MDFNGYLNQEDWLSNSEAIKVGAGDFATDGLDVSFYQSGPVIYTVTDPAAKVKVTFSDANAKNVAVSVVRIK